MKAKSIFYFLGAACIGASACELYKRQNKMVVDENAGDIFFFGVIGIALISVSSAIK